MQCNEMDEGTMYKASNSLRGGLCPSCGSTVATMSEFFWRPTYACQSKDCLRLYQEWLEEAGDDGAELIFLDEWRQP